jgi:hypothetical protein
MGAALVGVGDGVLLVEWMPMLAMGFDGIQLVKLPNPTSDILTTGHWF